MLQDVGTMKSLRWRCEMWVDCVERKISAKLPWSATWVLVSVLQRVDGVRHAHVFSCAYVCMYICMWVYIYVHFFAVSVTCT